MAKSAFRDEKDSLGQVKVPINAYYGAFTVRAGDNFRISGLRAPRVFMEALGMVKMAAAKTHAQLGELDKKVAKAVVEAAGEFVDGKYEEQFLLDVFQAGAGTSYHMNANEIIANRANEILGGKKGHYEYVHPNNHVNMAQSTNDVIPTATRLAALFRLPDLLKVIADLEDSLGKIAKKHAKLVKVGRTHLQDAVPITFGKEFDSYVCALKKSREKIAKEAEGLQILGIGGTAVGTGINSHSSYAQTMVANLSEMIGVEFKSASNFTEIANNMNAFVDFSGALRGLAINLLNICGDLKLMNTGPKAGLAEITLPPVQPGSSIMPGKINPSIPEAVEMVAMQVLGNDQVISLGAQRSNFELNVFCPLIMHNLLQSMEILTNGVRTLDQLAVRDLIVNVRKIEEDFEASLCTGTALVPVLGYLETADVIKTALKKGVTIKSEVFEREALSEKDFAKAIAGALGPK